MSNNRRYFQDFYTRICKLNAVEGKKLGRELFDLLCGQTVIIQKYEDIQHQTYGLSAYFSIYLHVSYKEKQLYLPGNLLLSMTYFNRVKPVLILRKCDKLLLLNHSIVDNNSIVKTEFLKSWNEHPSLFEFISDVVTQLQGDPFNYRGEEEEDSTDGDPPIEPGPNVDPNDDFNENIPYSELVVGKKLGKGAFGVVSSAMWRGKKVAVKEWQKPISAEEKKYLDREIAVQRSLNHPNCLRLYGISKNAKGYPVLVMELADCSLADLTTKPAYIYKDTYKSKNGYVPKLSNKQKCDIIREIAEGLAFIHSKGFIHRDIKLDNILMKDGHPKIADFGLARCLENQNMQVTFAGTALFMAPELISHNRITNTIDCYSFGCIVTEILYEETCYWDHKFRGKEEFFSKIRAGLRPTVLKNTPREVRYLLQDCFKSKSFRPPMSILLERIKSWYPAEWEKNCFDVLCVC